MNYMMEYAYDPFINHEKNDDWGKIEEEAKKQFTNYIEKFKKDVVEAMKLMEPGKEHFEIRPEELEKIKSLSES